MQQSPDVGLGACPYGLGVATVQRTVGTDQLKKLSDREVFRIAEQHLATLSDDQRVPPGETRLTRLPRLRRAGRCVVLEGVRLREAYGTVAQFLLNPRHLPGRAWTRLRLLEPRQTFNFWKLGLLIGVVTFASLTTTAGLVHGFWGAKWIVWVAGGLAGGILTALVFALWSDLFRCPWLGHRVRRHVWRQPSCVLLSNVGSRRAAAMAREEPLDIVPRADLYDDILPGVLSGRGKDVQILVGEPGSGKTTALIGIAGVLARVGIVPVLVPLHSLDEADLVELARTRFKRQINAFVRSESEADIFWRWLCRRRRVAILVDDLDRVGSDGERGFMLRRALKDVELEDLPAIVTARPAGVPAGIAASAIQLGALDEETAVECVAKGARRDPGFRASNEVPRQWLRSWIHEGKLAEVPFYLELLVQLAATGKFRQLPEPAALWGERDRTGRYCLRPDGVYEWNPLWVRFLLLENFYEEMKAGRIRTWRGIEQRERMSMLDGLKDAALGMLSASALQARAFQQPRAMRDWLTPERTHIVDFIATDDRQDGYRGDWSPDGHTPTEGEHGHRRSKVSAHEVLDAGERLLLLTPDAHGEPQFRHRIMHAYLAGRRLSTIEFERVDEGHVKTRHKGKGGLQREWINDLLDPHHPEKLTAQMALTFAALCSESERLACKEHHTGARGSDHRRTQSAKQPPDDRERRWKHVAQKIITDLVTSARDSLAQSPPHRASERTEAVLLALSDRPMGAISLRVGTGTIHGSEGQEDIDPMHARDAEQRRDPDDALMKLTTASDIARAVGYRAGRPRRTASSASRSKKGSKTTPRPATQESILCEIKDSHLATRWTKLEAIRAIAALDADTRWDRIWDFARDTDYKVRQAASEELQRDAYRAFKHIGRDVEHLLVQAAARSALGLDLAHFEAHPGKHRRDTGNDHYDILDWTEDGMLGLQALGTVLPAIVSGLREDPTAHAPEAWRGQQLADPNGVEIRGAQAQHADGSRDGKAVDYKEYVRLVNRARTALEQLVALAFSGGQHALEEAVADGFKTDAIRHALSLYPRETACTSHAGPGWVASHTRLVATVGLQRAESWYAQLMLHQALSLYAIAGADRPLTFDTFAHHLHRGGGLRHPLAQRSARLARAAVRRQQIGSERWRSYIWEDEAIATSRRKPELNVRAAQLLGDVTVLLDLKEGSPEDRQEPFGYMCELPHCLHDSPDRQEILGTGCPAQCGWNYCPYKQPPPDEPNSYRGVSPAFCRQQREIALRHRPPWQRKINRRRLADFWQQMERRART